MKKIGLFLLLLVLTGCASGRLDIFDENGNVVGECTAGYEWHPYGVKDSVDWLLNYCAQLAFAEYCNNCSVSDESIITKDYTIPDPPKGRSWNKKIAWQEFRNDNVSEQKYGYILAYIENVFYRETEKAREQMSSGAISETEYEHLIKKIELNFYGE